MPWHHFWPLRQVPFLPSHCSFFDSQQPHTSYSQFRQVQFWTLSDSFCHDCLMRQAGFHYFHAIRPTRQVSGHDFSVLLEPERSDAKAAKSSRKRAEETLPCAAGLRAAERERQNKSHLAQPLSFGPTRNRASRQLIPPSCRFREFSNPPPTPTCHPEPALLSDVHRPRSLGAQARGPAPLR